MKLRHSFIPGLITSAMLFGGTVIAQDATTGSATHSATYQTAQGEVVINSVPAPAPTIGPAPNFKQLSGDSKSITPEQAAACPPLANDFLHGDSNKDGKIQPVRVRTLGETAEVASSVRRASPDSRGGTGCA